MQILGVFTKSLLGMKRGYVIMNRKESRLHVPGSEKMTTDQENPSKKARPDRFGRKVLYTIFFDAHGSVGQICLPKGQRVTGEYATTCLAAVEQHYKERRPRTICKALRILHDNARPHKTPLVKDTLDSLGVVELQHPPYSPDLSPCDFWLFNNLKLHLSGRDFETNHQLGSAIFQ